MMEIKVDRMQRKDVNSFYTILLFIFTVSCAQIEVNSPSSRYITPEAKGKLLSGEVKVEAQMDQESELDFSNNKTDNELSMSHHIAATLNLNIGLLERMDFILKNYSGAPSVFTFKYQILGNTFYQAKKGDHSLAVTLGHGKKFETQKDDSNSVFSGPTSDIEAKIEHSLSEASIIYGKRIEDDIILYSSIQVYKQDINFELESVDNTTLNGKTFTLNSWNYGLAFGMVRYYESLNITLEASALRTDFNHNEPTTHAFVGAAVSYFWESNL